MFSNIIKDAIYDDSNNIAKDVFIFSYERAELSQTIIRKTHLLAKRSNLMIIF